MRKMTLAIVFSTVLAGFAYAGTEAAQSQMAAALPQPSTIFICTAGLSFLQYIGRQLNRRIP